jgi:hypothetical protein
MERIAVGGSRIGLEKTYLITPPPPKFGGCKLAAAQPPPTKFLISTFLIILAIFHDNL